MNMFLVVKIAYRWPVIPIPEVYGDDIFAKWKTNYFGNRISKNGKRYR